MVTYYLHKIRKKTRNYNDSVVNSIFVVKGLPWLCGRYILLHICGLTVRW